MVRLLRDPQVCPPIGRQEGELSSLELVQLIHELRAAAPGVVLLASTDRLDQLPLDVVMEFEQKVCCVVCRVGFAKHPAMFTMFDMFGVIDWGGFHFIHPCRISRQLETGLILNSSIFFFTKASFVSVRGTIPGIEVGIVSEN